MFEQLNELFGIPPGSPRFTAEQMDQYRKKTDAKKKKARFYTGGIFRGGMGKKGKARRQQIMDTRQEALADKRRAEQSKKFAAAQREKQAARRKADMQRKAALAKQKALMAERSAEAKRRKAAKAAEDAERAALAQQAEELASLEAEAGTEDYDPGFDAAGDLEEEFLDIQESEFDAEDEQAADYW